MGGLGKEWDKESYGRYSFRNTAGIKMFFCRVETALQSAFSVPSAALTALGTTRYIGQIFVIKEGEKLSKLS